MGSLITMNVRGLVTLKDRTKVSFFEHMSSMYNALFMIFTESWTNEDILDAEVKIQNFTTYRSDRAQRSRGGTIVYIRSDISSIH